MAFSKVLRKLYLIIIWTLIFMAFPFTFAQAYNFPAKIIIVVLSVALSFLILVKKRIELDIYISGILVFQIFTATLWGLIHRDANYVNFSFQLLVTLVIYLSIINLIDMETFIRSFLQVISVSAVLSAICFFLTLVFNINYYSTFINPDGRTAYNYIISFTNVFFDIGSAKIIRPAGFFDEPGALAFYIVIGIIFNDFTLKSKIIKNSLLLTGIFTLSVAFYLIMFFYLVFQMKFKISVLLKIALFIMIFCVIIVMLYNSLEPTRQDIIYNFTLGRVGDLFSSKGSGGQADYFKSDNRSDLIANSLLAIKDSPIIGQGLSYRENPDSAFYQTFLGANFLGIFGIHGILGGLIFSFHVLYFTYLSILKFVSTNRIILLKGLFLYSLLIIQRPDYIGGILPYVIVVMLVHTIKNFKTEFSND